MISLGRKQYPVQKGQECFRIFRSVNNKNLINIGRQNMILFGKIGGFAKQMIFAR